MLPDLSRSEFLAFQSSLFAAKGDESLDFITLIKVAELIGADLVRIIVRIFSVLNFDLVCHCTLNREHFVIHI